MPKETMFTMVLCDSIFSHFHYSLTKLYRRKFASRRLHTCICVADYGALLTPRRCRRVAKSAIGLAVKALGGGEPVARRQLSADPIVRILVVPAERSTAKCRGGNETSPRIVDDRRQALVVKKTQIPWTICDFEDVVTQRRGRRMFRELEVCKLRHPNGIYGDPEDELHFRKDIGFAAQDELLKAIQRTAFTRYGSDLASGRSVLLVLAAGWNTEKLSFCQLDSNGNAWRKVELVALAELCALNGQRLSVVFQKMHELVRRGKADHRLFLKQEVQDIVSLPVHKPRTKRGTKHRDEDRANGSPRAKSLKRKR